MPHEHFMRLALAEAEKGCGWVSPNPMVGAVIVKDGEIIGAGFHQRYGGPHAERNALASLSGDPSGAVMYVTLEPCCHFGKTPPCTDAIIESGISTVVVGSRDLNGLVAGKGMRILEDHGIKVIFGVLEKECQALNQVFFHYITQKTPFVVMKYAMTLDGKIATSTGKSKWITGETAREHVHRLRHRYSAIMAGVGTVIADDPELTCRLPGCKNPVRVICDTGLRVPLDSKVIQTAGEITTYIAAARADGGKARALEALGARILPVSVKDGRIDLRELTALLGELGIDSVLLEGGAALNASALKSGIVNKVQAYISPKIFGGQGAKSPVGGEGADDPGDAYPLTGGKITLLGEDVLLEYALK